MTLQTVRTVKVGFVCRNVVEADNLLPLIHLLDTRFPGVALSVLLLHPNREPLETPLLRHHLRSIPLRLPHRFFQGPALLSAALEILARLGRLKKGYARWIGRWFRVDPGAWRPDDLLFVTHSTLQAVLEASPDAADGPGILGPLRGLLSGEGPRIILCTETVDAFHEIQEYAGLTPALDDAAFRLLSRDPGGNLCGQASRDKTVAVGAPRYSRAWVERLHALASGPLAHHRPPAAADSPALLYLPTKYAKAYHDVDLKSMDRFVLDLLVHHPRWRLIIKPHPKTLGTYRKIRQETEHGDRITVFERDIDTALLVAATQAVITPGTSFVPHALWAGRPVVLLDGWAGPYGLSYIFSGLCHGPGEVHTLLDAILDGATPAKLGAVATLERLFQLGLDGPAYARHLEERMAELVGSAPGTVPADPPASGTMTGSDG